MEAPATERFGFEPEAAAGYTLTMKWILSALLLCGLATCAWSEVGVGDPREDVVSELGDPKGYLKAADYEILYYERGRVVIRAGVVSAVQMLTEEQHLAQQRQEDQERELQLARNEQQHLERLAAGEAYRAQLLGSPTFLASPASAQVDTWRRFMQQYPEVDARLEYQAALARYRNDLELAQAEQRIQDLEQRVRTAEQRVAQAQADADRRDRWDRNTTYIGGVVYPYPVYTPRRRPCPEVPTLYAPSRLSGTRLQYQMDKGGGLYIPPSNRRPGTAGLPYTAPQIRSMSYHAPVRACPPRSGLSVSIGF